MVDLSGSLTQQNVDWSAMCCMVPPAHVLFCCSVFNQPSSPSSSSWRSYNRRHYPAGRVHGVHCSFPHSLANIINNRSPPLSLHLCCLPAPPALKPGLHGGLRLQRIDYGRERERNREGEGKRGRESQERRSPAFIAITSHVGRNNTQTHTKTLRYSSHVMRLSTYSILLFCLALHFDSTTHLLSHFFKTMWARRFKQNHSNNSKIVSLLETKTLICGWIYLVLWHHR